MFQSSVAFIPTHMNTLIIPCSILLHGLLILGNLLLSRELFKENTVHSKLSNVSPFSNVKTIQTI